MRNGGLIERLDRATSTASAGRKRPETTATPAHLLGDVARALREAVDNTARALERDAAAAILPADNAPAPRASSGNGSGDGSGSGELPQILQHPTRMPSTALPPGHDRARTQVLAPVILALALSAVAILMSASLTDLARLTGMAWLADTPRPQPRLTVRTTQALQFAVADDAEDAAQPATARAAGPDRQELALLERCEIMIANGDMRGAREELARAANNGSQSARFALAETFDPNVLAAWGLRERVADVGTARTLYEQALAAGDTRARGRIEALKGEPR